jgi:hypothetical protein
VTAGPDLLDATGRRIVIQDATAGIEILLGADMPAPSVGSRVDITGRVGSAYGAPRLRANTVVRLGTGSLPAPLVVRGALTDAHTWRLVVVSGRIEDTRKLGDRARAEVLVGAQRIVVVAQPGSGIAAADLPEGAALTVTGIVRRAYPNATDRRPSLLPRSTSDLRVTGGTSTGVAGAAGKGSVGTASGPAGGRGSATGGSDGALSSAVSVADADLRDLASIVGQTVRVGGLVQDLLPDGFRLDDGTATGTVVMTGEALELLPLIEPGDAINVVGRVDDRGEGAVVVVDDPAGVILGVDLGDGSSPPPSPAEPMPSPGMVSTASLGDDLGAWPTLPGAGAGIVSVVLIAASSLVVTWLRRRHAQRLLHGRIARRLAALAGAPAEADPPGTAEPTTERGPSVGHAR